VSLLLPLFSALLGSAHANERRFTTTYESLTLPKGVREIEPWTTISLPRAAGEGISMKQRMEVEVGLTDRLLTSFYLNWSADPAGSSFDGVSSEWKLNLRSRATKAVGLALYGEVAVGPKKSAVEAKLILDEEWRGLVVAYNLVGELEQARGEAREVVVANHVGLSTKSKSVHVGAEFIEKNEWKGGVTEVALAAGPSLGFTSPGLWMTATLPIRFVELVDGVLNVDPAVDLRLIMGLDF